MTKTPTERVRAYRARKKKGLVFVRYLMPKKLKSTLDRLVKELLK